MALVVENGTVVTGANAYVDVAFADAYHSERCQTKWAGPTSKKEASIILATEWLDLTFHNQWLGQKVENDPGGGTVQPLDWPREAVFDEEEQLLPTAPLPIELRRATAEVALVALATPTVLYPDPAEEPVSSRRERAGRVEVTLEFEGAAARALPVVRRTRHLLRKLLGHVGSKPLVRV